jgi:methyl-accepting chemotaxis protein
MNIKVFKKKFLMSEAAGIGFGFPVATAYALLLVTLNGELVSSVLTFLVIAVAVIFLGIALPMDGYLANRYSRKIENYLKGKVKRDQYGGLLSELLRLPLLNGSLIFGRVSLGALVTGLYMRFWLKIPAIQTLIAVVLAVYGAYMAGLVAYVLVMSAIKPVTEKIALVGEIPDEAVRKNRFFSLGLTTKIILFLIVPIIFTNLSLIMMVSSSLISGIPLSGLVLKTVGVVIVNIITLSTSVFLTLNTIRKPVGLLEKALTPISWGEGALDAKIATDLSDELGYVSFMMNKTLLRFSDMITKISRSSIVLSDSARDLSVSTREITTTSNQQAAAVKEICTTMEDSGVLARRVEESVKEVSQIAGMSQNSVSEGHQLVQETLLRMEEIKNANTGIIQGISYLAEKIENIGEIVTLINSVAGQTKIIAFNAELEASAAGEAGKNFQIVALEIRRLADSTTSSTEEIKKRIREIQDSSNRLIQSSREGTRVIVSGQQTTDELRSVFDSIKSSSDHSVHSSAVILTTVSQQVAAFEQVLVTLKQISEGVNQFVESASGTMASTNRLAEMTTELKALVGKLDSQNEKPQGAYQ